MLTLIYEIATIAVVGQEVEVNPTAEGIPGGSAVQTILNWLGQYALMAAAAAVIAGGGLFAWARQGSGGRMAAISGTMLAAGGVVGALFVGLGPDLVNTFYNLGS